MYYNTYTYEDSVTEVLTSFIFWNFLFLKQIELFVCIGYTLFFLPAQPHSSMQSLEFFPEFPWKFFPEAFLNIRIGINAGLFTRFSI